MPEWANHPAVDARAVRVKREGYPFFESDSFTEPFRGPCFSDFASCNRQHGSLSIVGVGRIGARGAVVQVDEHDE